MQEAMPISKKDKALNSLVNFGDLNKDTKAEEKENKEKVAKPVYIKPTENAQASFVPQASLEAAQAPQLAIEKPETLAITFQPSADVMTNAKQEAQTFAGVSVDSSDKKVEGQQQPVIDFNTGNSASNQDVQV